ncbi:aminoglycoside phosphotransferase family protein [Patescibacteria group bacterium]|nr:aminoglycoside phosphotransferase family protein [Patescibacteria group bacterium]
MIFIKLKNKINIKKTINKEYMFSFFKENKNKFLNKQEKILKIKIYLNRNFMGKFRNISLVYKITTNKRNIRIRARAHNNKDIPFRDYKSIKWLRDNNINNVPIPLYYDKSLNIFFYKESPGQSFERLFNDKNPEIYLDFSLKIADFLRKMHKISRKPDFLPIKTRKQDIKERRHWFFLTKKCCPKVYPFFRKTLKGLWTVNQKNLKFFDNNEFRFVHGDVHWGNVIKNKDDFSVIDFCWGSWAHPLEDVACFLAQNDSMFRYYMSDFLGWRKKIRDVFIKKYFKNNLTHQEEFLLTYFEIQKILEMAAIHCFVEGNKDNKINGANTLITRASKKLKQIL